jgi:hypothetical protein
MQLMCALGKCCDVRKEFGSQTVCNQRLLERAGAF